MLDRIYIPGRVLDQKEILDKEVSNTQQQSELKDYQKVYKLFTEYGQCLYVGCGLQLIQQLSGINTIMYYGPIIIMATGISFSGFKPNDPKTGILLNCLLSFVNTVGNTSTLFFIEKFGRRHIMLKVLPYIIISLLVIAFSMYLSNGVENENLQSLGHFLAISHR